MESDLSTFFNLGGTALGSIATFLIMWLTRRRSESVDVDKKANEMLSDYADKLKVAADETAELVKELSDLNTNLRIENAHLKIQISIYSQHITKCDGCDKKPLEIINGQVN